VNAAQVVNFPKPSGQARTILLCQIEDEDDDENDSPLSVLSTTNDDMKLEIVLHTAVQNSGFGHLNGLISLANT
jgi:hypothetical protein